MQITLQINNGNQNLFNAIKALLKTQPKLDFTLQKGSNLTVNGFTPEFEAELLRELEETKKAYKSGKIKSYSSAKEMHEDILNG